MQKKDTRVQTILLIIVLGVVILLSLLLLRSQTTYETSADVVPEEVVISNLTSSSVTISWFTKEKVKGFLNYGLQENQYTLVAEDLNDEGTPIERNLHYFTISNLQPNTRYYFQITSGTNTYTQSESPFTFQTFQVANNISTPKNLLIALPTATTEGILYAHASDGTKASTTISTFATSANLTLDKNGLKDQTTGELFDLSKAEILLSVTDPTGARGSIKATKDTSRVAVATVNATQAVYKASTIFATNLPTTNTPPVSTPKPTTQPTPQPTTPTPTPPTNTNANNNPPTNQQQPLPSAAGNRQPIVPKTAISQRDIALILQMILGIGLIMVGGSLVMNKPKK
jgi:hypothetical protein